MRKIRILNNRLTRPFFNPAMRMLVWFRTTRKLVNLFHNRMSFAQREAFFWSFASAFRKVDTSRFKADAWIVKVQNAEIPVLLEPDRLWERWGIAVGILGHDSVVKETYANILGSEHKPDTFIDIGANYGTHSLLLAKAGVRAIAFEPNPECVGLAFELFRSSGVSMEWHQVALGREQRQVILTYPAGDFSLGSVSGFSETTAGDGIVHAPIQQRRLDDFAIGGTKVLVKIDVEGHELDVLVGGKAFISAVRPLVIFESNLKDRSRRGVRD
jgi:FkbM family methyltransferase